MQCINRCIKRCIKNNIRNIININILRYNTFPVEGWIFNCFNCDSPTSNSIILDKFEIYICKSCLKEKKKNKSYKQKYINQCNCLYDSI